MSDEDHLHGFSTDDDDSSDEEVIVDDRIDVGKLPTVAKDDATVQKKLERAQRQPVGLSTHVRPSHVRSSHHRNTTRASSRSVVYPMGFTRNNFVPISRNSARYRVYVYPGIKRSVFRVGHRLSLKLYDIRPESRSIMHSSSLIRPPLHRSLRRRWTTICSWDIYSNAK